MAHTVELKRTLSLIGAVNIGLSALIGGGIFVLSGVACSYTGAGIIAVFIVNGVIALLAALSVAELSTLFPESGGTYMLTKKIWSVRIGFGVGWILWLAAILSSVFYAIGLSTYGLRIVHTCWQYTGGNSGAWLLDRHTINVLAVMMACGCSYQLLKCANVISPRIIHLKHGLLLFIVGSCIWAWRELPIAEIDVKLLPMFPNGLHGFIIAMGYTFGTLQGFSAIAALAGEIRDPEKNIPKAILISLVICVSIYLVLVFSAVTLGVGNNETATGVGAAHPETLIAFSAQRYLGGWGFWLIMVTTAVCIFTALNANMLITSRIVMAMARDRTLPFQLGILNPRYGSPVNAIIISLIAVVVIIMAIPNLAAAGAACSLIHLLSFLMIHWINFLTHRRIHSSRFKFRIPGYPLVPLVGGITCLTLAVFLGIMIPAAGLIIVVWLGIGGILYWFLLARRAQIYDASNEALNPELIKLRGRNPLILVPIANPVNAEVMVMAATALTPPSVGRMILLSILSPPTSGSIVDLTQPLMNVQTVIGKSLTASLTLGASPEVLTTIAQNPWQEIDRVAKLHHCESLILGFSDIVRTDIKAQVEKLINDALCDVVIIKAPNGWQLNNIRKILVPIAGHSGHAELRARFLSSLCRTRPREITYLQILPPETRKSARDKAAEALQRLAQDEINVNPRTMIELGSDPIKMIIDQAREVDLIIVGMRRAPSRRYDFGEVILAIARETSCGLIIINQSQ